MAFLNNANDASGSSIFIIEDDVVLRDELASLLELNGYEVHCCKDLHVQPRRCLQAISIA